MKTGKTPRKKLEDQLDRLWSKCIKTKQKTCWNCNSDIVLQSHHIRSRGHRATRWDLENGLLLCRKCHCMQKFNPERFQDSVLEIIGQREYDRMKEKSLKIVKYNMKDLEEVFEFLTEKLRELEADYGRV